MPAFLPLSLTADAVLPASGLLLPSSPPELTSCSWGRSVFGHSDGKIRRQSGYRVSQAAWEA